MDAATREALCAAAVKAARAVNYVGAGTIEFIADASEGLRADRIWFMEMNTRLQVEHPVTEEITGVDLVEWQLRVASGEALPLKQEELSISGWAMEARLYAEDPAKGFLPSVGKLERFELGDIHLHGGRIDTGVEEDGVVSPYYDPMIAKVIGHGQDRDQARQLVHELVGQTVVWPVRTNAAFLVKALEHPDFVAGNVDTGLIGRDGEGLASPPVPSRVALAFAAENLVSGNRQQGFRLNAPPRETAVFNVDGSRCDVVLQCSEAEMTEAKFIHVTGSDTGSVLFSEQGQTWALSDRKSVV